MGDNARLAAIGLFFVLVLGCIGFLLIQGENSTPEPTSENTRVARSARNGGLSNSSDPTTGESEPATSPIVGDPSVDTDGEVEEDSPQNPEATSEDDKLARNTKRPRGPGIIKGIVTWHGDGAPVSGARIMVDYTARAESYDPYPEERNEWTDRSDSKGEFRVTNLPVNVVFGKQGGRLTVIAEKDGASAVANVGLTDDETQELVELQLRPAGGIAGTVVDEDGNPVPGAIVTPDEMTDKDQQRYSYGARSQWTAAGKDGRFQLKHLNTGDWKLAVKSPQYAMKVAGPFTTGDTDVRIVLVGGSSVSGTVVDAQSGEPVADTFVTVNDQTVRQNQLRAGTDESGRFLVTALADSDYQVLLDDKERVLVGEAPKFSITNGDAVEGLTLVVAQGGAITGMVTDADTGSPIPGVRIRAQGDQRGSSGYPEGMSDETGFYRISAIPGGSYTLRRRWKQGYLHGEYREDKAVTVALGETLENIDFQVRRGLTLSGTVVDKSGEPIQGLQVTCAPVVDNGEGESVTTTEGGEFALRGFSPNVEVNIDVGGRGYTAPKYGPVSTGDSGLDDIQIVVEAGASIAGVVVDQAGKPLSAMYVSAASQNGGSGGSESTASDGTFLLKSLEEGTYRLTARRQNSWSSRQEAGQEVTVSKGQELTGVRVVYNGGAGSTISGRITNAKREPLENASISAYSPNGNSNASSQTDEDGQYELDSEDGIVYTMHVYHQRYSTEQREGVEGGSRNIDFVLEGRGTVEGQVLDGTTGRPIASFEISHHRGLSNQVNYQYANYKSFYDVEGNFSLTDVESGDNTLYARAKGYAPALQHVTDVAPDDVTDGVQFRLVPGAAIEGTVRNLDGKPIEGARIFLSGRVDDWMIRQGSGYGGAVATSDADGNFSVDTVGEDLTQITAVHPEYPNTTVDVALSLGDVTTVEIVMSGGAIIEGTVYINDTPAPNQQVYVMSATGGNGQSGQTDANGFYHLENVPEGESRVNAIVTRDGAQRNASEAVTVRAGYTTTLDLHVQFGSGVVEGTVTMGGRAVTQGHVGAMLVAGDDGTPQHIQGTLSADGTYRVAGLSSGDYRLMVQSMGENAGSRRMRMVEVSLRDGQTVRLDIDLEDGVHVRGTVAGASDTTRCHAVAISGAVSTTDLAAQMTSPDLQLRAGGYSSVAADGTFDISGLSPGDYTIIVSEIGQNGYADARFATGQVSLGASGDAELNLALP